MVTTLNGFVWQREFLTEARGIDLNKLFLLVFSNAAAGLEPPDLNPVSDENVSYHGIRAGEE